MEGKVKEMLLEMQLSNYLGKSCIECGHIYDSVEDINNRAPRRGHSKSSSDITLVCAECWEEYAKKFPQGFIWGEK